VALGAEAGAATDDVTPATATVTAAAADALTQSRRRIRRLDDFIPSSLSYSANLLSAFSLNLGAR
jgi:hypothetical protein